MNIQEIPLTPALKEHIEKGFSQHAIEQVGVDGFNEYIAFQVEDEGVYKGVITVRLFWGQLYIAYLFVEKAYRGQRIGEALMTHALEFGKSKGCTFAFLQTMSFQAPNFYEKLGFKIDFVRPGYLPGYSSQTSFYYLSKGIV